MSVLKISDLSKKFGNKDVLNGISLELNAGEILAVLGKSGCGKSTLLRIVAGLESADSGDIKCDEKVSLMFQNYALMPHLSVSENIALAILNLKKPQREIKIKQLLDKFFISDIADAKPDEISGGQAQRVAFARAVAGDAKVLLLDEPFSNLDASLRQSMRSELKNLIKQNGISAILVTHDKDDAFVMSDKIALLQNGKVIANDTPKQLYLHPKTAVVASFLGEVNDFTSFKKLLTHVEAKQHKDKLSDEFDEFYYELYKRDFLFRPEDVVLGGKFKAKVLQVQYLGAYQRVVLSYEGAEFCANIYESVDIAEELCFGLKPPR